jgi:hypothetical protein
VIYNLTGHPVKEYIRKRRLSNALALVKYSDLSFPVIANSCGYLTQQAFCRSVKTAVGQTPLEYKKSGEFYYFPKFGRESGQQITVSKKTIPMTLNIKYYSDKPENIENSAVSRLFSLLPGFNGRIFGRNGE